MTSGIAEHEIPVDYLDLPDSAPGQLRWTPPSVAGYAAARPGQWLRWEAGLHAATYAWRLRNRYGMDAVSHLGNVFFRWPQGTTRTAGKTETLTCETCDDTWTRTIKRGPKPTCCPDCQPESKAPSDPDASHQLAGVTGYLKGCRCGQCSDIFQAHREALDHYLGSRDTSLETAGELLGVTRERARQVFDLMVGEQGGAARLKRVRIAEHDALQAEIAECALIVAAERDDVTCSTCGRRHHRWRGNDWRLTCSSECSELWHDVRYLTEEGQVRQLERTARWVLANRDKHDDSQIRLAEQRLSGQEPEYSGAWESRDRTRWLNEGSRRFQIVLRAYREGWPAFETWPQDIQDQIREYVEQQESAA